MKKFFWEITNLVTGKTVRYSSNCGIPVDENHVRNSPSVKTWANGNPISIK
jgi:hypothetical protein